MSLAGIDIGSGSAKVSIYSNNGKCLGIAKENFAPRHPKPGWWELEPEEIWKQTFKILCKIAQLKSVRNDPPEVLAISASGREIFPVNKHGEPLGTCIMAGDMREYGIKIAFEKVPDFNIWFDACGHIPERMDPVCRLLWWRRNYPSVVQKAQYFLGWHEYLTLKLCGRPVTDRSLAGKWLIYDIKTHAWSQEYMSVFGIRPEILPEIVPWGNIIGVLDSKLAHKAGLPQNMKIAVGGFDACCSALGTGVGNPGTGCLLSGTWENLIIPVTESLSNPELIDKGISVGPFPGITSLAVFALSPNGNSVVNWAGKLTKTDVKKTDTILEKLINQPSEILAIPDLSGSAIPWGNNIHSTGAFIGLSLATSAKEIIKSLKESIVFNLQISMSLLRENGIKVEKLYAAGGGTNSEWWTQLKSDLLMIPIEVTNHEETGTAGAAILAGYAAGIFIGIKQGADQFVKIVKRYEPNKRRLKAYKKKINLYRKAVFCVSEIADKLKDN